MKRLVDIEPLYSAVDWPFDFPELNTVWPNLIERNRSARNYIYEKKDENAAKWSRITRKALTVAVAMFALALLVGWAV